MSVSTKVGVPLYALTDAGFKTVCAMVGCTCVPTDTENVYEVTAEDVFSIYLLGAHVGTYLIKFHQHVINQMDDLVKQQYDKNIPSPGAD